ncbi:MAG: hypothetical protein KI792_13415 [Alphaproteobacteria bacterium]|nr:hypothetical protein [Alphaproteobacteria bacterium SS10]
MAPPGTTPGSSTKDPAEQWLVPSRQAGWFRLVTGPEAELGAGTPGQATYLQSGPDAPKPLAITDDAPLGEALQMGDSTNLLDHIAAQSLSVRQEVAGQVIDHLLDAGADARGRYRKLTQARLDAWSQELTGSDGPKVLDDHLDQHQAVLRSWLHKDFPSATAHELQETAWAARRARSDHGKGLHARPDPSGWVGVVTRSAGERMLTDLAMADTLVKLEHDLDTVDPTEARSNAIQGLIDGLTSQNLVRAFDDMEPFYGEVAEHLDLEPREGQPVINVIDMAQRHWDEVDPAGNYPGGIAIGNNAKRVVPAAAVEQYREELAEAAILAQRAAAEAPEMGQVLQFRRRT